jgi:hypothetical protein
MGQVIGQSTRDGGEALSDPVRISNLVATVLRTLVDYSELRVTRGVPNEILQAATAEPIARLF